MRATFFLMLSFVTLGLFLWISLSGAVFVVGCLFWLLFLVITVGYQDTVLLVLLGARELRSSDEKKFFEAASQQAYKLALKMPRLYFYNGTLERAFVFHTRFNISIVLNKELLEKASSEELNAICFELLLQVKKGMAAKRTRTMFFLGFFSWFTRSVFSFCFKIVPFKEVKKSADWLINFLIHPFLDFMFRLMMGERYFRKLEQALAEYPDEKDLLDRVGLKLRRPYSYYSLPSRKLMELQSVSRSRQYQSIMTLEFLPHEWDYLFKLRELRSVE